MDSILFLIAQFLTPFTKGLDVIPFEGDCKKYEFTHPVGVVLLKLDAEKRLTVEMPFRTSGIRVAADYLELIRNALGQGVPLDASTELRFAFERHNYLGFDKASDINFHGSTFILSEDTIEEAPAEPVEPAEGEEAE